MTQQQANRLPARRSWSRELRQIAREARLLTNPFFEAIEISAESEGKQLLRVWADQDYYVSMRFPCLLGILIGKIHDEAPRHLLVKNLWEEHGEGHYAATHFGLFKKLRNDLYDSNVPIAPIDEATSLYLKRQEQVAIENLFAGLGAFCYANEYVTLAEFGPLEEATIKWFPEADRSFFRANRDVDPRHASETEDVIEMLASDYTDIDSVRTGAVVALEARATFYDALVEKVGRSGQ